MPNADAADPRPVATSHRGAAWSLVRWLVFSLLLAIVAVIACLPAIVGTPERVTKLIATAIPELAADVKPASVRLGWFGPIVLEDLAIVPRTGDRTPLEVHRVEVEHGLAGILLSAGNLGRVRIEGLRADVVFDKQHRTNLDSIPEIVRQLRLRDLGGLIIIDFIDMAQEKHRRSVEKRLIDELRGDRSRIKVGRISPFGMLEITRQRVGPGLKRTVFMQCPHCKGAGWSRTIQSKALSVLREVRALLNLKGYSMLQVFANPGVNDYLSNYKRRPILDLEDAVGKTVVFRPEPTYPIDVVHYRFLTGDGQPARIAIPAGLGVKA